MAIQYYNHDYILKIQILFTPVIEHAIRISSSVRIFDGNVLQTSESEVNASVQNRTFDRLSPSEIRSLSIFVLILFASDQASWNTDD